MQAYAYTCCIYMYMYACKIYACITLAWNGRPIPSKVHAWNWRPTHAKFMLGREHPCKVHAWKRRPMHVSCMKGDIHAKFMQGKGDPCKVHAWKGKVFTQRRYISTSWQYIDIIGTTWCPMMYQTLHQWQVCSQSGLGDLQQCMPKLKLKLIHSIWQKNLWVFSPAWISVCGLKVVWSENKFRV